MSIDKKALDDQFKSFMTERNDILDNLSFDLLRTMSGMKSRDDDPDGYEWDMSEIGALGDTVESILDQHGHTFCHPYVSIEGYADEYDDTLGGIPCYREEETNCQMRKDGKCLFLADKKG